jgi:hypothetical protein
MADNTQKVGVEVEVKGAEKSISSIKDLKTAIKDARNEQVKMAESFGEGSDEYVKASKKVAELKDKVDDLNDSTKSLGGTGLERASSGMQQFGEGLKNLDFQKVKVGLTAMKTAFAAVGIGLIVQLISYLIENFDSLSKGSGGLAVALRFVADILKTYIDLVGNVINYFTDLVGLTSETQRAIEAQGQAFEDAAKQSKDAIAKQSAEYDNLINAAKSSGKSTVDLEIQKQQAIINTNKVLLQQALDYLKNGGQLDEAKKKLIQEELASIKTASAQIEVIKNTEAKRVQDVNAKALEERKANEKKIQDEINDDIIKSNEIRFANIKAQEENAAAEKKQKAIDDAKALNDELNALSLDAASDSASIVQSDFDLKKELGKQNLENFKNDQQAQLEVSRQSLQSVQNVSDLFFSIKSAKLKKGSAEELALAKKQFNVNKALQLGLAVIDGYKAVTTSLASAPVAIGPVPNPAGIASLAFAVTTSLANIAKIAASKFEGGGASPSAGGSPSGGGGASIPAPPTISNQNANVEGTQFDENGKRIGSKNDNTINVVATVGVDEITAKTNRVNVLEKQSTF